MRRGMLAAVLLAILHAQADAETNRVAVFTECSFTSSNSGQRSYAATMNVLQKLGLDYDVYSADARTWGVAGTADSTWFRQRYAAVVIPYLDGQASGTPVVSSGWSNSFQDGSANTGVAKGPLSGRWQIPVFVIGCVRLLPSTNYDDGAGNFWVPGITHTGPAGSFAKPAQTTYGTWGYRALCRLRGDAVDTLYCDPAIFCCRPASWSGNGSVAAIVWADTVWSGGCSTGDTTAAVWRYRPLNNGPGIYYSTIRSLPLVSNDGTLIALQYLFTVTSVRPPRKITIPLMEHAGYAGGGLNATAKTHVRAMHDTMAANGLKWSQQLSQLASGDYAGVHDADTRAELRRVLTFNGTTWSPGSNGGGQTFAYYQATDTVEVRKAFNADMNCATRPDSFGLPASRMQLNRVVTSSGLVGSWMSKVLADAGVKIVESTLATPDTAWSLMPPSGSGPPVPVWVRAGANQSENRSIRVAGTFGIPDGASFSAARGVFGDTEHDYVTLRVMNTICRTSQTYESIYWHTNTNVTGTDGYMRWIMSVLGRQFRYYDRVIAPDDGMLPRSFATRNAYSSSP